MKVPLGLYEAYRASAEFVSADGRTVQFAVGLRAGDPAGTAGHELGAARSARRPRRWRRRSARRDSGVAGEAPAFYDINSTSTSDLQTVIPIAIAIIAVLLGLVMRSVVAPIYLIISVGLSYLAALGLSVLLFGHNGLTFILPFLMFIFLLALGEDYNILVMTRIREEAKHLPLREAVRKAMAATSGTVTSAGLVLAGTFAVFAIAGASAGGSEVTDIGAGIALGVLMDTFLVRTVLVPATVVLLGRWNWWPSKLGRKELPRTAEAEQRRSGVALAEFGEPAAQVGLFGRVVGARRARPGMPAPLRLSGPACAAGRRGWRGRGSSRPGPGRPQWPEPGAGPSSSATATARLSATTGVGVHASSWS